MSRKPFVIIDAEILSSSVWSQSAHVRLVWITLLILCDTDGYVGASVPGIASAAGVTLEQAEEAIELFQKPDRYSRTKDNEGRRLELAERGYRVLNFMAHIDRLSAERRRSRDRVKKHRARKEERIKQRKETPCNAPEGDGNVTVPPESSEQGVGKRDKGQSLLRKKEPVASAPVPHIAEDGWPSNYPQVVGEKWDSKHGAGSAHFGIIGSEFGKLRKAGAQWLEVSEALARYFERQDVTFPSSGNFCGKWRSWLTENRVLSKQEDLEEHNARELANFVRNSRAKEAK